MEQAILQVSLKEYKKSIDDLRASLLSLDSASEEYKTTVGEIRDRQQKLNEVMSAGKSDVDAVAGSYNALQQQMAALKKEWKSMEIGTEEWKAMAAQINSLNDQLKDADALTGNFQRNVGDYANAFGAAFDKAAGELGKMPGPLGTIFKVTKDLIPAIKAANKTATTGLAGVKKALVSTGIGALVVAVGLLVSHWGDLMKLFKGGKSAAESAAEANDKLNAEFEEQNFQLGQTVKIMEAQGASTEDIIAKKQELIKKQIESKKATIEEAKATLKAISNHTWLGRVLRGEQADYKALTEQIKEQEAELKKLEQTETNLSNDAKANAIAAYKKEREEADKLLKTLEENYKTEERKLTEKYQKELALLKKHHKDTKALTAQYNKDMATLSAKMGRANVDNAAEERALGLIGVRQNSSYWQQYIKNAETNKQELIDYVEKNYKEIYEANKEVAGRELNDVEINQIYGLLGFGSKFGYKKAIKEIELEITEANNSLYDSLIKDTLSDLKNEIDQAQPGTEEYFEALRSLAIREYNAVFDAGAKEGESEAEFNARKAGLLFAIQEASEALVNMRQRTSEFGYEYNAIFSKDAATTQATKNFAFNNLKIYQSYMEDIIKSTWLQDEEYFEGLEEGSEEMLRAIIAHLEDFPEDARSEFLTRLIALKNAEEDILAERRENWLSLTDSIADVSGSISQIIETSLETRKKQMLEEGKTEEEANAILEKKFKTVQAFQAAEAVVSTLAGATQAFAGIMGSTGGWGTAAAIAKFIAVLTTGAAQVQKIYATNPYENNSASLSSNVSVSPQLGDYTPQSTANLTSASDQDNLVNALQSANISVSVTDINRVQNRVKVREGESRF